MLGNVEYKQPPGAGEIYWAAGIGGDRAALTDYRKLDLVLAPLDSVSWTVEIPANLEHAEFQSALAACPLQSASETAHASCKVSLQTVGEADWVAYSRILDPGDSWWGAFRIPFDRYAGKVITITLTLEGRPDAPANWGAMFQYPVIDLFLNEAAGQVRDPGPLLPSNTDVSPYFVKPTPDDFQVNLKDAAAWNTGSPEHSSAGPVGTWSIANADSVLRYISPLSIRLGDYSHLYLQVAGSKDVLPRAMFVILTFDEQPATQERSAAIPLLADDAPHGYTLDLTLLDMPSSSRVTGIALQPLAPGLTSGNPVVQVSELRFVRKQRPN